MKNHKEPARQLQIAPEDLVDLAAFPLSWRWTDPRRAHFTQEGLQSIRPLSSQAASRVRERIEDLLHAHPQKGRAIDASGEVRKVSEQLRAVLPTSEPDVVLSWEAGLAIIVRTSVFIDHWDDFCYPSSDDVEIWTPGTDFMMTYRHWEVFEAGADAEKDR
jgi:hypothetical protein